MISAKIAWCKKYKVCVSCLWQCPGTSTPSAAHPSLSLFSWSSGTNTWDKFRALEGCSVSSKSPSRIQDGDEKGAGRNDREKYVPDKGSLISPPGKSKINLQKRKQKKIEVVAGPDEGVAGGGVGWEGFGVGPAAAVLVKGCILTNLPLKRA